MMPPDAERPASPAKTATPYGRRTLLATGVNHALHDGYSDLIYVLLPVWQSEFGLGYAALTLVLAGAGCSTQHPLASAVIGRTLGGAARGPLGTYDFSGDLGKAIVPPLVGFLLTCSDWRSALWFIAGLGVVVALGGSALAAPLFYGQLGDLFGPGWAAVAAAATALAVIPLMLALSPYLARTAPAE